MDGRRLNPTFGATVGVRWTHQRTGGDRDSSRSVHWTDETIRIRTLQGCSSALRCVGCTPLRGATWRRAVRHGTAARHTPRHGPLGRPTALVSPSKGHGDSIRPDGDARSHRPPGRPPGAQRAQQRVRGGPTSPTERRSEPAIRGIGRRRFAVDGQSDRAWPDSGDPDCGCVPCRFRGRPQREPEGLSRRRSDSRRRTPGSSSGFGVASIPDWAGRQRFRYLSQAIAGPGMRRSREPRGGMGSRPKRPSTMRRPSTGG